MFVSMGVFIVALYLCVALHELIVCLVHRVAGSGLLEFVLIGPGAREPRGSKVFGIKFVRCGTVPLFPMAMVLRGDGSLRGGLWYSVYAWFNGEVEPTDAERTAAGLPSKHASLWIAALLLTSFLSVSLAILITGLSLVSLPGPSFPVTVEGAKSTELLLPGDTVQKINGRPVHSAMDLAALDASPAALTLLRSGNEHSVTVPGDSFTFKRGEYRMTFLESLSVVRMMTIDIGDAGPVRTRHFTMLLMSGHPLGIAHYFTLISWIQIFAAAFALVVLSECISRSARVKTITGQVIAAPQRGVGLIEYAVIVSAITVISVAAIKPLRIWGVQFPICRYLHAQALPSGTDLIAAGYFNEDTGRCRKTLAFVDPPYWE